MRILVSSLCWLALCGCGATNSVAGKVTYEGADVEDGFITFFPVQSTGAEKASPIKAGTYEVSGLSPGPHIIEVIANKKIQYAASTEEMAAKFKVMKTKGNATGAVESADLVPANARGNRQTVEVKAGRQTMDFRLKKP